MHVNICHRLIKEMIENGTVFTNEFNTITGNIPKGVYASCDYKKDEIIKYLEGTLLLTPTKESIHIGNNMYIVDKIGKFINHSSVPNTKICMNKIIAIKEIKIYDEITFDIS